jgi:hypothetical protein
MHIHPDILSFALAPFRHSMWSDECGVSGSIALSSFFIDDNWHLEMNNIQPAQTLLDPDTAEQRDFCILEIKRLQSPLPPESVKTSGTKPFASVLIATYNRWPVVRTLLDQMSRQTYSNYEVVIIDGIAGICCFNR